MGDRTSIEWADATWNPVTGCDIALGCMAGMLVDAARSHGAADAPPSAAGRLDAQ